MGKAILALVAVLGVCHLKSTFVPPARRSMAAAGAAATLGAAPAFADAIDDAAKKLSEASYPFLKEVDWNSDIYTKIPGASPSAVLKAVDKALVMGAAMDPAALKAGVLAHHKAIGSVDAKGVTSLADYEAINAALGHMIASVPTSKTMDVYNAFSAIVPKRCSNVLDEYCAGGGCTESLLRLVGIQGCREGRSTKCEVSLVTVFCPRSQLSNRLCIQKL